MNMKKVKEKAAVFVLRHSSTEKHELIEKAACYFEREANGKWVMNQEWRNLVRGLSLARDLALDQVVDLVRDLDRDLDRDLALARALTLARDLAHARALDRPDDLARDLDLALARVLALARDLAKACESYDSEHIAALKALRVDIKKLEEK